MLVSGAIVLAFIVFHLLHFTVGTIFPADFALRDPQMRHDVFRMMLLGFSRLWVVLFYVVAMVVLFFHLSHGIWSATHSLGFAGQALDARGAQAELRARPHPRHRLQHHSARHLRRRGPGLRRRDRPPPEHQQQTEKGQP